MKLYVLLCVLLTTSVLSAQPETGMPSEPGKCYAKCLINSKYETITDMEWVYTGTDFSIDGIEEYVYKTGVEVEVYFVVKDTSIVKYFEEFSFDYKVQIEEGFREWREILCYKNITVHLYRNIQKALISNGYYVGPNGADGQLDATSRAALVHYQKDFNLPIGSLDIETLEHMGVDY